MNTAGGVFEPDPDFSNLAVDSLLTIVDGDSESIVSRGRAILEIGRRAEDVPFLQEQLFEWARSEQFAAKRWVGRVTLAWISACCLGYSLKVKQDRARLADMLGEWPEQERELLLAWAKQEDWFAGIG